MENKILVENGRTIITNRKVSGMKSEIKPTNKNILDEMQSVYDTVENGYKTGQDNFSNQNQNSMGMFGGQTQSMLTKLLPLLKNMGGKNMGNIANIMSSLPSSGTQENNLIGQLLPLLQNMSSKKQDNKEIKIDSFKRADE